MEEKVKAFFVQYRGVLLALLLTIFAILPLFQPGFFPIHDDEQVGRLYELDNAVKSGHIPPRIATNLGFGYGYPLFNFYPSFVYYIAEVFVLLGFSYIVSIKFMIALGFLAAAFFMYLFAREYFGEIGGVVASVAYTYAPYHAVDVYVRGALPEFWSFAFVPALFWSFEKLLDTGKKRYVVYSALFICFLILTHNLVALMSGFFLAVYLLYLFLNTKEKQRVFIQVLLSGMLGLLLSAYFWIPSYFEKNTTMIELLTTELADYRQHFVYIRQFWNSPWGYGGSLYGLYDGLSFQIGKAHIILAFLSLLAAFYLSIQKKGVFRVVTLFIIFLAVSVFLMTFYSQFIWDSIREFSYIQFPWRFLLFASFSASFLVGSIFLLPFSKKMTIVLGCIIIIALIGSTISYFQPEKYFTTATDADYIRPDVIRWRTSIMAFEYVPKGIATRRSDVGTTIIDIDRNEIAQGTYQVIKGPLQVKTLIDKPQEKQLSVTATESGILRLNTYAFPGWKVYIDEQEIGYNDDNKLKLITVAVPEGEHTLRAVLKNTIYRSIGNILTVVGLVVLILYIAVPLTKLKSKK